MNQAASPFELRIQGMDCAEEVAILKRELVPLLGNDERLGFDLLNGKLTVNFWFFSDFSGICPAWGIF